MSKNAYIYLAVVALTACGGTDPSAYSPTVAAAGSSTATAEANGTIKYAQYQAGAIEMFNAGFTTPYVNAAISFNASAHQGTIQFPAMGMNETIATSDGYATSQWTGPFMSGSYNFNGNILMGCNSSAASVNDQTQIFVSSNLARVQNGLIDDMNGQSFDLYDCAMLKQNQLGSLKINSDGSLFISTANYTIPKGEVFDMLNPESYPGALITSGNAQGRYSGRAFKYGVNGATKYAIVIQTIANNATNRLWFHYFLAVQR